MFELVGFSGSRRLSPAWSSVVSVVARAVSRAGARVVVGCAAGADAAVRSAVPAASVFAVSPAVLRAAGRGAFAARSVALVRAVASSPAPAFCAFVVGPCPAGVAPARSWRSGSPASGSWSSAALAAGLGVPLFVWWCASSPPALPAWPGGSWSRVSGGLFRGAWSWSPEVGQPPLF